MKRVNVNTLAVDYDGDDPAGYRSGMNRFGPGLGARTTGCSVYEIPPGESICPYHYEFPDEEWLLVVTGRPTLRHPGGEDVLEPGDVVFFPSGPEGAHKVTNDSTETLRVLMFSSVTWPSVAFYPDSDKVGVYWARGEHALFHREADVGYYDREP